LANENASFHNFVNRLHKQLLAVHANIDRAKAEEAAHAVQTFQRNAPRGGKWKRRKGQKSLYRSIVLDAKAGEVHTEERFKLLEEGGVIRSGGRWLPIPKPGRTMPFGRAGYFALPERGGKRVIVKRHNRRGVPGTERAGRYGPLQVHGVFRRQVTLRRTGWETRAREELERARRDEVVADKVLPLEGAGG
jgi:hypothetical protein